MSAIPSMSPDYSQATLLPGAAAPMGALWTGDGVNFALYSSGATKVELCLYDSSGERELARLPLPERTENVWHGFLPHPFGAPGLVYGFRVHGPYDPSPG